MKRLLVLLLVAAVLGMLAYNYVTTGTFTLLPWAQSEDDRQLAALERQLDGARGRQAQAQRMAGAGGIDTSREFAEASQEVERLEQAIAALKKRTGR